MIWRSLVCVLFLGICQRFLDTGGAISHTLAPKTSRPEMFILELSENLLTHLHGYCAQGVFLQATEVCTQVYPPVRVL